MNINSIEIQIKSTNSKKINECSVWDDISQVIRILSLNGYQIKIRQEECVLIIEYDYADAQLTENSLEWINWDEIYQKEEN